MGNQQQQQYNPQLQQQNNNSDLQQSNKKESSQQKQSSNSRAKSLPPQIRGSSNLKQNIILLTPTKQFINKDISNLTKVSPLADQQISTRSLTPTSIAISKLRSKSCLSTQIIQTQPSPNRISKIIIYDYKNHQIPLHSNQIIPPLQKLNTSPISNSANHKYQQYLVQSANQLNNNQSYRIAHTYKPFYPSNQVIKISQSPIRNTTTNQELPPQLQARKLELLQISKQNSKPQQIPTLSNQQYIIQSQTPLEPSQQQKQQQQFLQQQQQQGHQPEKESLSRELQQTQNSNDKLALESNAVQQLKEIYEKSYGKPYKNKQSQQVILTEPNQAQNTELGGEQNMSFGNSPKQSPIKQEHIQSYGSLNNDNLYNELRQIEELEKKISQAFNYNNLQFQSNKSVDIEEANAILQQIKQLNQNQNQPQVQVQKPEEKIIQYNIQSQQIQQQQQQYKLQQLEQQQQQQKQQQQLQHTAIPEKPLNQINLPSSDNNIQQQLQKIETPKVVEITNLNNGNNNSSTQRMNKNSTNIATTTNANNSDDNINNNSLTNEVNSKLINGDKKGYAYIYQNKMDHSINLRSDSDNKLFKSIQSIQPNTESNYQSKQTPKLEPTSQKSSSQAQTSEQLLLKYHKYKQKVEQQKQISNQNQIQIQDPQHPKQYQEQQQQQHQEQQKNSKAQVQSSITAQSISSQYNNGGSITSNSRRIVSEYEDLRKYGESSQRKYTDIHNQHASSRGKSSQSQSNRSRSSTQNIQEQQQQQQFQQQQQQQQFQQQEQQQGLQQQQPSQSQQQQQNQTTTGSSTQCNLKCIQYSPKINPFTLEQADQKQTPQINFQINQNNIHASANQKTNTQSYQQNHELKSQVVDEKIFQPQRTAQFNEFTEMSQEDQLPNDLKSSKTKEEQIKPKGTEVQNQEVQYKETPSFNKFTSKLKNSGIIQQPQEIHSQDSQSIDSFSSKENLTYQLLQEQQLKLLQLHQKHIQQLYEQKALQFQQNSSPQNLLYLNPNKQNSKTPVLTKLTLSATKPTTSFLQDDLITNAFSTSAQGKYQMQRNISKMQKSQTNQQLHNKNKYIHSNNGSGQKGGSSHDATLTNMSGTNYSKAYFKYQKEQGQRGTDFIYNDIIAQYSIKQLKNMYEDQRVKVNYNNSNQQQQQQSQFGVSPFEINSQNYQLQQQIHQLQQQIQIQAVQLEQNKSNLQKQIKKISSTQNLINKKYE